MKILLRRRGRPGSIFRHGMLLSSRGIGHGISAEKNELRFFLPETNSLHLEKKYGKPNTKFIFQTLIFMGYVRFFGTF